MPNRLDALVALFAELRRRRVVRAALVYLGGAFIALSVADVVVETYRLPGTLQLAAGIVVFAGFPVALVLAWMYEWTGGRIRRVPAGTVAAGVRPALAGLIIVMTAASAFVSIAALSRAAREPVPADSVPRARSVLAVLPFEGAVPADGSAWLAPALEARLEDALAETPEIRLRSRRAVAAYPRLPLDSLARLLGVDYFVQGQVAQAGGTTTVVIQLVDAETSTIVGSGTVRESGGAGGALGLVGGLTDALERVLRPALGREVRVEAWRAGTESEAAFQLRHRADERLAAAEAQLAVNATAAQVEIAGADSLLALSQRLDPRWIDVRLARARAAERMALARLVASRGRDMDGLAAAVDAGLAHADGALLLRPGHPEGLALRARLTHLRAHYVETDPDGRAALVDRAEADLRAALREEPDLVEAAATLSEILFLDRVDYAEARWFAERAYRGDAYMENSSGIIHRIARSAFELGDDAAAAEWCREGMRRFPDTATHHACALEVMAWGDGPADPDGAWRSLEAVLASTPPGNRAAGAFYRMTVAGVLARAGLTDSARVVIAEVTRWQNEDGVLDPLVLLSLEAAVRFRMGEHEAGRRLYERLREADPGRAARTGSSRMLRDFVRPSPG